jgi:hypothetical protein
MNQQTLPTINLPQTSRQALVGAQYGALVIGCFLMLRTPLKELDLTVMLVFILGTAITAVIHTTLALSIGNICQGRLNRLDERERASRDQAFVLAFQILSAVVSVLWIYGMLASFLGWWLPVASQFWVLLWGLGMLAYGLPTSIAAFKMPDGASE